MTHSRVSPNAKRACLLLPLQCGYLADKYNRVRLLVTVVIVGEAPCLATYWVSQLWQFFLLRMLTGIAVGGCFPLVFSLLGDLFPVNQRSAMSALVQIAVGAGIGGGQVGDSGHQGLWL